MGWKRTVGSLVVILIILGAVGVFQNSTQGPDPHIVSMNKPEGEAVDQDIEREGETYRFRAQLQNSGQAGDLFVTLWIGPDTLEELPNTKSGIESRGFERIRTGTFYFNSGERRWVEFTESDIGEVDSYAFYGFASSYSAVIENRGETGRVNVSLVWNNTDTGDQMVVDSKTITIQGDSTQKIEFNVNEHPGFHHPGEGYDSWEIVVEPA